MKYFTRHYHGKGTMIRLNGKFFTTFKATPYEAERDYCISEKILVAYDSTGASFITITWLLAHGLWHWKTANQELVKKTLELLQTSDPKDVILLLKLLK